MKKSKLVIWAIIVIFLGLIITQNQSFFLLDQSLRLNLLIMNEIHTPKVPVVIIILIFFISGLIIAYLLNLPERFRSNRKIKKLNATLDSHLNEISSLKKEIDELKGITAETEEKGEDRIKIDDKPAFDQTAEVEPTVSVNNPEESSDTKKL